ncbi:MAG: VCBS repeat-containing protein, partial [Euryarchaeota archaeon]|nr:VCBS repeat-containing protein [Euryarchaeota archaeon]
MDKNRLRSTVVTLIVVVTVLIGMIFGATADSGNVSNMPEAGLTISTPDTSLTSVHDDWHYRVWEGMSEGQRLNRINPDMIMVHPERFERFSGRSDISRDMPDWIINSQMNRTMSRTGAPDRSVLDRLAGENMTYQKVSDNDVPPVMSTMTLSEFTCGIPAGDLNGDGGGDVLVFSGTHNSTTYPYNQYTFEYVSAVSGCDGTELWGHSIVYKTGWIDEMLVYLPVYPVGDLDGDGKEDVLVFNVTYNSTTYPYQYTFEYVSAVSGCDGTELWGHSIVYKTRWIDDIPVYPVCDLDGDGKEDVLVHTRSYDSGTNKTAASVYAKRGYDGYQFWSQSVTGDGESGIYMQASSYCDLDGDNKDDVTVNSRSYNSSMNEYT